MICLLEDVGFRYPGRPTNALTSVSLGVDEGTHVALVGPNGAGKSTLLRILTGVLRASHGTVTILGRRAGDWKRREMARHVAVVSQAGDVRVQVSVRDLVSMGRYPYLSPWSPLGSRDQAVVNSCLEAVDLTELADRDAAALSGGELQRARLARALAQEPRLLLLDEPTAHLDPARRRELAAAVGALAREASGWLEQIVVVSHDAAFDAVADNRVELGDT